ncbi:MAG: hypothetical protein AAGA48_28135 [Myxococcota bacterium]
MSIREVVQLLPSSAEARQWFQAAAMLDSMLAMDEASSVYRFDSAWAPRQGLASMQNGSGDHFFIVFGDGSAWLKGFDHESQMSPFREEPPRLWPGLFSLLPNCLMALLKEPAFAVDCTTFCTWNLGDGHGWTHDYLELPNGLDPDGATHLTSPLLHGRQGYLEHCKDYFEVGMEDEVLQHFFGLSPLSRKQFDALPTAVDWPAAVSNAVAIGYPVAHD